MSKLYYYLREYLFNLEEFIKSFIFLFLREFIFEKLSRNYIPATKVNFIQLMINDQNWAGLHHFGFVVENIKDTAEEMAEKGARILNSPAAIIPGRFSCYLQDPDGNWLEFVEDLNM